MKHKSIIILALTIFILITIAGVSAADTNNTAIASEDTGEIELSASDDISVNNIETNENNTLTQANNEETVSAQTGSEILTDDQYTYSDLREQIKTGGNKNLTKGIYTYNNDGDTIVITTSGVINGNGAVIDMTKSGHRAFSVTGSGVTIINLTIKNSNYNGDGGAIYFSQYGTVTNCNFVNNYARYDGGAIYFKGSGSVENCNFTDNKVTGDESCGGAVYFYKNTEGNVTNCNFIKNTAENGGAIYFDEGSTGRTINCNFTNNKADNHGGAVYFNFRGSGTVTNCNFTYNKADAYGGAVYFRGSGTVTNCNFTYNKADAYG